MPITVRDGTVALRGSQRMGGRRRTDFSNNLRASLFNDDVSNEPNFGWIHPSRWTAPLKVKGIVRVRPFEQRGETGLIRSTVCNKLEARQVKKNLMNHYFDCAKPGLQFIIPARMNLIVTPPNSKGRTMPLNIFKILRFFKTSIGTIHINCLQL